MEMDFENDTLYDSDSGSENESISSDDNCDIIDKTKESDSESGHFEVLTTDQIVQDMTECINDVRSVIDLPRTTIRTLLNHFKWDKEALTDKYFDGNEETFFSQANITNPYNKPKQISTPNVNDSGMAECEVCYTFYPPKSMTGLECGHRFCTQCWTDYLTMKIMNDGHAQFIKCPAYGCDILIDDLAVLNLITDPTVKVNYEHLITNNFVKCNRLLRWCPSVGCKYGIKVAFVEDSLPIVCKCSHKFCYACTENWHDPVKCQELKKWLKKCNDDTETSNWIIANTKECPKCCTIIEKNGGCNHMSCRNETCKLQFCWVCVGVWENLGHKCNQFNIAALEGVQNDKIKAELNLKRYLHYYNRYMNHMKSLKFEKKLYPLVEQKIKELRSRNVWNKGQFLIPAVDVLCKCRQTLMYTYPFAFYLKKNNHSQMFEDNQNDLEAATEMLSGYLESKLTTDDFVDFAQKVEDKYRYCEKRRKILLDHVHEGYENRFWDVEV